LDSGVYRLRGRRRRKGCLTVNATVLLPITVVNIDAGFVAGAYAARIANMIAVAKKLDTGENRMEEEKNLAGRRVTKRRRGKIN